MQGGLQRAIGGETGDRNAQSTADPVEGGVVRVEATPVFRPGLTGINVEILTGLQIDELRSRVEPEVQLAGIEHLEPPPHDPGP